MGSGGGTAASAREAANLAEMKYELHKETSALIWRLFKWQTTTALAVTGIVLTVLYYFPPA